MEPTIIGKLKLIDSKIKQGKNCTGNVIYCDNTYGDVVLEKSILTFNGSNGLMYIVGGNHKSLKILATANNDTTLYIGQNSSFHKSATIHLACSECSSIVIGNDCMFSRDIWIRTGDSHCVYSVSTHDRINNPKNVILGDHVWIGQDSTILKGATIGSGAIVGGRSLVTGKKLFSCTSYGGSPAKMLSEQGEVFFTKPDVNSCTRRQQSEYDHFDGDDYVFTYSEQEYYIDKINEFLAEYKTVDERIEFFKNLPNTKNRFSI